MILMLTTIYDKFDEVVTIDLLNKSPYLFGQVVSYGDIGNTKAKLKLIGSDEIDLKIQDYPDMKFTNSHLPPDDDPSCNWFYLSKGKYIAMHAQKSEFTKVKHLEDITFRTSIYLRLRIVVELLKRNIKKGVVKLTEADFIEIAVLVLLADPNFRTKDRNTVAQQIAQLDIRDMLFTPLWEDISANLKGRVAI